MTTSMTYARTTDSTRRHEQMARIPGEPAILRKTATTKFPGVLGALCLAILVIAGCKSSAPAITVQVQPSTAISIDEGQSISFTATVANDTQNQGVSWSLAQTSSTTCSGSGCGTLSKMTNSSVTYTAPTNLAAGESVTLTVASVTQPNATTTATISVVLPVTFTTITLPNGSNGVAYNQTIAVTGGVAPLNFSLQAGTPSPGCGPTNTLPQGLSLTSAGTIVGKPSSPTVGGNTTPCTFTVVVTDTPTPTTIATPLSVAQSYTVSIAPPSTLSINTTSLPTATSNTHYAAPPIAATGGVLPLTWSVVSATGPAPFNSLNLALNPTSGQLSGTIPATATSGVYSLTVKAQDQTLPTNQTASQNLTITVQAPTTLSITTATLTPGTTATPYSQPLQASGGIPPYTWTLTSGLLPSGLSFNSNGILSGTPVLAMANDNFTVQVQDSEVTPQVVSQPLTISIAAGSGNGNSLISGAYSFLFNGYDTSGTVMVAGSITTDGNGTITGGMEDSNRVSNEGGTLTGVVTGIPLTGSYSLGTDGRGTMQLVATNPQTSVTLTTDYRIVLDSTGTIHFIQNNDITTAGVGTDTVGTHGEGILKPVPANFNSGAGSFLGNYSFLFSGQDMTAKPTALGGVIHADGTSTLIPAAGGVGGDLNDNGTFTTQNISGTFSASASNNRGTAAFLFDIPGKSQTTIQFAYYFVSQSDMFWVEIDQSTTTQSPIFYRLSGEMIAQPANTAFSGSALVGTSVATGSALSGSNASVFAGLFTSATAGTATLAYDENNGGTIDAPSNTGTYAVATNGRVAFTGLGSRAAVAYLTGPGQGFLLGSDAGVTTGLLEQQTGITTFSTADVEGGYTLSTSLPAETKVPNVLGQITSDGAGNIPGTSVVDEIDPPTTGAPEGTAHFDQSLVGHINFVGPNGRSTATTNSPTGMPAAMVIYLVSPAHFRGISADSNPGNAHPEVFFFDH